MEKPIVICYILSLLCIYSSAFLLNDRRLSGSNFPSLQAEKLIRELNLFPKEKVNIVEGRESPLLAVTDKRIVEKKFKFPNLVESGSGVSVEDLGHHAGYYKLPHSHDARYFSETLELLNLYYNFMGFSMSSGYQGAPIVVDLLKEWVIGVFDIFS